MGLNDLKDLASAEERQLIGLAEDVACMVADNPRFINNECGYNFALCDALSSYGIKPNDYPRLPIMVKGTLIELAECDNDLSKALGPYL